MKSTVALVLQLLLLRVHLSRSGAFYSYTAKIMKFEPLDGIGKLLVDFRDVHVQNADRSLNGTVHILEDMDAANFQMSVDFRHDPNRNNHWRPMIFSMAIMDVCSAMRMFVGTYGKTTLRQGENTNLPFTGRHCPVPQGTYYVKNMLINTDTWPDLMPFGGLKTKLRFYKHGKFVGGFGLTLDVERKPLLN